MLASAQEHLGALKSSGTSMQDALAAQLLTHLQAQWGNVMFDQDKWLEIVWDGL
jgi:hypothetical protein